MKKTVNINLAGTFFHIDEDAFGKLSRYIDAIKKSISNPQGSDEIIRDIEARIAELFSEKIENNTQVISLKELDEVIGVMGQPEDYQIDEDLFEDAPYKATSKTNAHLYRDVDNKFLGGVSSGLGHYFKIDALWIRLLWILLTLASSGFFIIIYIIFWILVPAAVSVSDKLKMNREEVNISNIERKFKEGMSSVADGIKKVDYDKYGNKIKSGTAGFFETLGKLFTTLFNIIGKLFGVFLVIISISALLGLIVSLFTFGSMNFWGNNEVIDTIHIANTSDAPLWLISLLTLFAVGVPFFTLLILGLKLLVKNLKSIGATAKIILLVLWLASLVGFAIIGIKQATDRAYDGEAITEKKLPITAGETIKLKMNANILYNAEVRRRGGLKIKYNEIDERVIYSNNIRLILRSTKDSTATLQLERSAEGKDPLTAKKIAQEIEYNYSFENGELALDGYFVTDPANKYRDQQIQITLFLPEGTILIADENTASFHINSDYYRDILHSGKEGYQLLIKDGKTECLDCPTNDIGEETEMEFLDFNESEDHISRVIIDGDTLVQIKNSKKQKGESVRIKTDGVEIDF